MADTVLVVDDGPDWRNMLAGLLKDVYPKIEVLTAASVKEAVAHLTNHHCILAVIDIRLDESDEKNVDGLKLLEQIKTDFPTTQALIITGYSSLETVEKALQPNEAGVRLAIDYVEKAQIQTDLLPRISQILDQAGQG